MGDGYAVAPEEGLVYAPISGVISSVFPTKHAIGITSAAGLEVLVHMGLDTVEMDGEPFETKIAAEDEVQAGDVLSQVDIAAIKASNRDPAVVVVFTNMEKVKAFDAIKAGPVAQGDQVTILTYAD